MRLFVYGTLRPGLGHALGQQLGQVGRRLGLGRVFGRLYDYGAFPVAVPDASRCFRVTGEVFEVEANPLFWSLLDEYEDFKPNDLRHSHFRRAKAEVEMESLRRLHAQIYWYRLSIDGLAEISGGDYCDYLRRPGRL